MKAEERIKKLLQQKGYVVADYHYETVTYGRDCREGGYLIEIDEESLTDDQHEILKDVWISNVDANFENLSLVGFNLDSIVSIINLLPDASAINTF